MFLLLAIFPTLLSDRKAVALFQGEHLPFLLYISVRLTLCWNCWIVPCCISIGCLVRTLINSCVIIEKSLEIYRYDIVVNIIYESKIINFVDF
jgi:hypothetical protein